MDLLKRTYERMTTSSSDDDVVVPKETDKLLVEVVVDAKTVNHGSPAAPFPSSAAVSVNLDDLAGLSSERAARLLEEVGPNEIPNRQDSLLKKLLMHLFANLISILIWLAVITTILVKDYIDLGVLLGLQALNTVIMFTEARKAQNALATLAAQLAPTARVIRDGQLIEIEAKLLVPGDVVKLTLGSVIPADAVIATSAIQVEQSALTGESLPCSRSRGEEVYSSSHCTKGETLAVVTQTGLNTLVGKQAKLIGQAAAENGRGPFEKLLRRISFTLLGCAVAVILIIGVIQLIRGPRDLDSLVQLANLVLVLLVASIPVAMQAVSTTTMAVGARRLATHGVICTKLPVLLDLASMEMLCADKTGTLTKNVLSLSQPWLNDDVTNDQLLLVAALACDFSSDHNDAIDTCVLQNVNLNLVKANWKTLQFNPFDPATKRTEAVVQNVTDGRKLRALKGAHQTLLSIGRFPKGTKARVEQVVNGLAERGLRSLGVCLVTDDDPELDPADSRPHMQFLGLLSFYDPPRDDTANTIRALKTLGVGLKMISGDHRRICAETCKQLGLPSQIYGAEFFRDVAIKPRDLIEEEVSAAAGFAEVFPEHKYFVVDACMKRGEVVVAMTGDGVNDASALKKADIGIAVSGASDSAISASDLVLSRPGIGSIVTSIVRARKIFERLRNYLSFRITVSASILFCNLILIAAENFSMVPISIVFHVILMDLTVLMISKDKVFPSRKPCRWRLMELAVVSVVIGLIGALEGCLTFWLGRSGGLFFSQNLSTDHLHAMVYLAISFGSQLSIFSCRTRSLFFSRRPGWGLLCAVAVSVITAVMIATYAEFIEKQRAILWRDCGCVLVICLIGFVVKDLVKTLLYQAFKRMEKHSRKQQIFFKQNKEFLGL